MLDQPASSNAAWAIYAATGVRPEWLWPSLWLESNFSPSIENAYGCVGINQLCPVAYRYLQGVDPSVYRTWLASQQLQHVVLPYLRDVVTNEGPVRSATKMQLAQLSPALLRGPVTLDTVIWTSHNGAYGPNSGLDHGHKGYITVGDLALSMQMTAQNPNVQAAIAAAYAVAPPGVGPQTDPVYGNDFGHGGGGGGAGGIVSSPSLAGPIALVLLGLAAIGALAAYDEGLIFSS
jgi:hypothetical protein